MKHEVMLAPNKLANITNLDYPVLIQPKYDGFRATYIPTQGFLSRTGKEFRNSKLTNFFSSVFHINEIVLDGEFYIPNIPFQELASAISKENGKIPPSLRFIVFDAIPLQDWKNRSCDLSYVSRLKLMRETINRIADYPKILDITTDKVNSSGELLKFYKDYLTKDLEGIMIKSMSGKYHWGRIGITKQVQKLKPFKSKDLTVTGVFNGKGKLENMIGGIICDFNGNSLKVGVGFTMPDRKIIFENPDKYIGRIAEIKYFEETKNGSSFRHPIFSRWRDDK